MKIAPLALVTLVASCSSSGPACDWTQSGRDATHRSEQSCVEAQPLSRSLGTFTADPFAAQVAQQVGYLPVHYQAPLLVGEDVYMLEKAGTQPVCDDTTQGECGFGAWADVTWGETHLVWSNGTLAKSWRFETDWKPLPLDFAKWETVFHPAVFGDFLYVPGGNGSIYRVDRHSGAVLAQIKPSLPGAGTAQMFVTGPLTIDSKGSVFFNVLVAEMRGPTTHLVRVSGSGEKQVVSSVAYDSLVATAPAADDLCDFLYAGPIPSLYADGGVRLRTPLRQCDRQRAALNTAPAVGPDGTIFIVSRSSGSPLYSWVVALTPELTVKWATSLRGQLADGCGERVPDDAQCPAPDGGRPTRGHCCAGSVKGVDPWTNQLPVGQADDQSTSSPVVLPDGTVLYGATTLYNEGRGHLFHFSADGAVLGTYDFGWDVSPAVATHDGTYSIVTKDNHYGLNDGNADGPFAITRLSPVLTVESGYQNASTSEKNPQGFEWCVNSPAIDAKGVAYANNEDGSLYAIKPDGSLRDSKVLHATWASAYTPVAIDRQGRVFSLTGGALNVTGR